MLHLTDLHLHGTPDRDYFRAVMDRCAAWRPDLVAFTGDIADSPTHHRWIVPLLGRLRWNVAALAILGNHDHYVDVVPDPPPACAASACASSGTAGCRSTCAASR